MNKLNLGNLNAGIANNANAARLRQNAPRLQQAINARNANNNINVGLPRIDYSLASATIGQFTAPARQNFPIQYEGAGIITPRMEQDIRTTLNMAKNEASEENIRPHLRNLKPLLENPNPHNLISYYPDITIGQNPENGNLIIRHQAAPETYLTVDSNRKMIFVVDSLTDSTRYYYQDQD